MPIYSYDIRSPSTGDRREVFASTPEKALALARSMDYHDAIII